MQFKVPLQTALALAALGAVAGAAMAGPRGEAANAANISTGRRTMDGCAG